MQRPAVAMAVLALTAVRCEPTLEDTLREQARSPVAEIRAHVARHAQAPAKALRELSTDSNAAVRALVAQNPNTPSRTLKSMLNHSLSVYGGGSGEYQIIARVAVHPNSPSGTLETVAETAPEVLALIMEHSPQAFQPKQLASLARYDALHKSLVGNPQTPMVTFMQLKDAVS